MHTRLHPELYLSHKPTNPQNARNEPIHTDRKLHREYTRLL